MKKKDNKKKGFTLIELLAVIIILGVIMLIAIPSVTRYISDSRKNSYIDTARQIVLSVRDSSATTSLAVRGSNPLSTHSTDA